MTKVLAIDYGKKRVGLATGSPDLGIAFPREVLLNSGVEALVMEVVIFVSENDVSLVVVGLPLHVHEGETNRILPDVYKFVELLKSLLSGIDVVLFDERYSSFEADELMSRVVEAGGNPLGRDAYSAQVILQRYFDKIVN